MEDLLGFKRLVEGTKRNCKMCHTYRHLNPESKEKPLVLAALNELYNVFLQEYDKLRRHDSLASEIQQASANRRMILDTIDACKSCNREVMLANQALRKFKF